MIPLVAILGAGLYVGEFFYLRNNAVQPVKSSTVITVGYWKIRGLAAPLRMMCEYAGVPYKSVEYTTSDSWFAIKPGFVARNPMANLPYVDDGTALISQSNACYTYLGKKFNIYGNDEKDAVKIEQVLCEVMDLRNNFVRLCYNPNTTSTDLNKYLDGGLASVKKLEDWFKFNKTTFSVTNDKPSCADFHLWEMLDQHEKMHNDVKKESLIAKHENLKKFYEAFRQLPSLQNYFRSDAYKLPINNGQAVWGNQ